MFNSVPIVFLVGSLLSLGYFNDPTVYTKPIPIWVLSFIAFSNGNKYGKWIGTGLLFSSIGDICLELDKTTYPGKGLFIGGLLAFLVAHLLYIVSFLKSKLDYKHATALLVPLGAYYFTIMSVLIPRMEPALVVPVLVYGIAICGMALFAILRSFSNKTCGLKSRYCSLIGSLVFVLSDSILAVNKFAFPIQDAHFYVMVTYYFGQTYLAASTVQAGRTDR